MSSEALANQYGEFAFLINNKLNTMLVKILGMVNVKQA
jgi:hypothetical protein